ncbi:putative ABC transport system ATP-binding protein [Streptomyces sp. 3330]|uniref:ABC transporter ATP-binding protein n=1 Tax=Streptomyces sp. 3330 TaxID=2817755 RepID=UPI0028658EFC|nr:ABC transporter ATP-binding protein [Streptomyces sp. 3330]MDR6974290.1 putative ABC transport system ATP-binding protein [Streptomyces sp. 3330]
MATSTGRRPTAAASLKEASRTYGSGSTAVNALDRVSVDFAPGTWTAVMGPSGSGKSTLLHCAAGLERVDAGSVRLQDTDITHASEQELTTLRRKRIGFIFQNFNLISSLTAEQNVALPLKLARADWSMADVRQALAAVGLSGRLGHRPRELSGGQQQRVAIARALVTRPDVLFADEPTGALDSRSAAEVLTLLRDLADRGQTIIMVTHDPAAAARADATVFLRDGRIVDQLVGADARTLADHLIALEA